MADRDRDISQPTIVRLPSIRRHAFVLLVALLVLCYVAVLVTPYAFTDDYVFLAQVLRGEMQAGIHLMLASGRPTYALLVTLVSYALHDIGDLRYLRLAGVLSMALLAWGLYRTLVFAGWDNYPSLFLSIIVVTMPPFQVYAAWATTTFYLFAALAASGAFYLAERAFAELRPWYKWSLAGAAVFCMLLALTMHQSTAMFFWVLAAVVLLQPDAILRCTLRRFGWYAGIVLTGLVLGFGVYQWGMAAYGFVLPPARSRLTHDVLGKALWFCSQPLMNALNVARLSPQGWLALASAVLIAGGLTRYFRGGVKARLWQGIIAMSLVLLSYCPNLLVAENASSYRTQSALTSLVVVYILLALQGYGQRLRRSLAAAILAVVLGLTALGSSLVAAYNVNAYFARPQLLEFDFMRRQLASQDLAQASSIYIIGATWRDSIAPVVRYDEFGLPSSAQPWSPTSAAYLLLRELKPERLNMPIELAPAEAPISPPPGALVVDMRKLSSLR